MNFTRRIYINLFPYLKRIPKTQLITSLRVHPKSNIAKPLYFSISLVGYSTLHDRLRKRGLIETRVPGDNHCLYHSIIKSFDPTYDFRDLSDVKELRNIVADYLVANREKYEPFIEGDFDSYIQGVRNDAFGDHITINALAELLRVRICVIWDGESDKMMEILPPPHIKPRKTIYLSNYQDVHFNVCHKEYEED